MEYQVRQDVTRDKLLKNGFRDGVATYFISKAIYENSIFAWIHISKDTSDLSVNVCDKNGDTYAAYYNDHGNNENVAIAKKNCDDLLVSLMKKRILKRATNKKKKPVEKKDDGAIIKIKYHNNKIPKLGYVGGNKSDMIDLYCAEEVEIKKGEYKLVNLGVSMELPVGYEAHMYPRSSTFKNFKVLMSNSVGIIDNSFNGTNDVWRFPAFAVEDTVIHVGDRIAQFRIVENQPTVRFHEVKSLNNKDRSGIGSTGKR